MNRFVKINYNNKISPYLLYIDEDYNWTDNQIITECKKASNIAKMAFLDHGQLLIPIDILPELEAIKPAYITPIKNIVFLVYEGGNFMTLIPEMKIIEEKLSIFYPIENGAAIICENDPFDKNGGGIDYMFENMYKKNSLATCMHYMFSFHTRNEEEIINAFLQTPAILVYSSYTDVYWWELLLRCYVKSHINTPIICKKPYYSSSNHDKRYNLCINMGKKFAKNIIEVN